jgi:hypothetical protein
VLQVNFTQGMEFPKQFPNKLELNFHSGNPARRDVHLPITRSGDGYFGKAVLHKFPASNRLWHPLWKRRHSFRKVHFRIPRP